MPGLDERLHGMAAAAVREVAVPPPDGLRRRGTRRRRIRQGLGGLAVVVLGAGCLFGVRAVQGPDPAYVQPASDLPGAVQIEIVPTLDVLDSIETMLIQDDDGRLSMTDAGAEGMNDLWSFPQPDPDQNLYQIEMVSPGSAGGCLSSKLDHGMPSLLPCETGDTTQLWQIESEWDTVTIRGLGGMIGESDGDLLTILVDPSGGPQETAVPAPAAS